MATTEYDAGDEAFFKMIEAAEASGFYNCRENFAMEDKLQTDPKFKPTME